MRRPDTPKYINGWLYSDAPQLSVHITSFEDATLVSVSRLHSFIDALGRKALFDVWELVLEGREDEVPPLHGFDEDPLTNLETSLVEPYILTGRQLRGLSTISFAVRYIFELLSWRKEEARMVCLPSRYLKDMRKTALEELSGQELGDAKSFVSEGVIICAWWTRVAIHHLPQTSNRTVCIMNAVGLRALLSKDLLPPNRAYISNALHGVYVLIPVSDVLTEPLSAVGSKIRQSTVEQGTRDQVEAFAVLTQKVCPVVGDSTTQMIVFSNHTKAGMFRVDFSAAAVKQGLPVEKRASALGQPSYINIDGYFNSEAFSGGNSFPIVERDAVGNYWPSGSMRASLWPLIEKFLVAVE
ncbi:hypothetical protein K432DRAFT_461275 [Lepidopterella palustris CBS 459.81]|uniref:Uncharacterized protein n=1 Tax=Lepidopterella palustris CBS 459.81 TaxID=1314670 RepID=A0A8E2JJ37_9PEZI|nr:hypothetical protein K432DRAFT_461275 [Lepidopterella palustris CBS 459.81]